jgi:hypothetical protein
LRTWSGGGGVKAAGGGGDGGGVGGNSGAGGNGAAGAGDCGIMLRRSVFPSSISAHADSDSITEIHAAIAAQVRSRHIGQP